MVSRTALPKTSNRTLDTVYYDGVIYSPKLQTGYTQRTLYIASCQALRTTTGNRRAHSGCRAVTGYLNGSWRGHKPSTLGTPLSSRYATMIITMREVMPIRIHANNIHWHEQGRSYWQCYMGFCDSVPRGTRQWNQKKTTNRRARGSEVHPTRDDLSQPTR